MGLKLALRCSVAATLQARLQLVQKLAPGMSLLLETPPQGQFAQLPIRVESGAGHLSPSVLSLKQAVFVYQVLGAARVLAGNFVKLCLTAASQEGQIVHLLSSSAGTQQKAAPLS